MRKLFFFILVHAVISHVQAQSIERSVISSVGGYIKTDAAIVSYSIGELIIGYYKTDQLISNKGFQQPPNHLVTSVSHQPDPSVRVHPNPFKNEFYITYSKPWVISKINILDMMGRLQSNFYVEKQNNETRVFTSQLVKGVYLLKLTSIGGREFIYKVVKQQ